MAGEKLSEVERSLDKRSTIYQEVFCVGYKRDLFGVN
jgi:hypothetical protein